MIAPADRSLAPIANSANEWRAEMARLARKRTPSVFHLTAPIPLSGRTNQVLAATPTLNVVLKTYAEGGENALHAHPHEDHLFVVLQGSAVFQGPGGEERPVSRYDCVMLPAGSYYKFQACGDEALVMLRVGAALAPGLDVLARIGTDGQPFDGYSDANHERPPVLAEGRHFA